MATNHVIGVCYMKSDKLSKIVEIYSNPSYTVYDASMLSTAEKFYQL
jgi:hypothetical protein